MDRPIREIVQEVLERWIVVNDLDTSVLDPEKKSWMNKEIYDRRELQALQKAMDLDDTGLTALMIIRGSFEHLLEETTFKAIDLILGEADVRKSLEPLIAMRDVIEGEQVVELFDGFRDKLKGAAEFYGVEITEDFEKLINDKLLLAEIRRDALLAMERLECHQFVQGNGLNRPLGFNQKIYEFWNVNSLLAAMRGQMEGGITLCLIRDPEHILASFFVFAFKNGDNILFLTDRAKVPHPDFYNMSRSRHKGRARDFLSRAGQFWLPYQLLELDEVKDDEGNIKMLFEKVRYDLVPYNTQGVPLSDFKDLPPEQIVWLTLVFDRINNAFWKEGRVAPQLSYTGEMVVEPHALVGEHGALITQGHYQPLALAPIGHDDMKDMHNDPQWQRAATAFNHWMVERYEDQVPASAFNVVGKNVVPALVDTLREDGFLTPRKDPWPNQSTDPTAPWYQPDRHGIKNLNPTTFGTAGDLDKDRKWAARMNQVRVIQKIAEADCEKELPRIWKWFVKRVEARREFLLDAAAHGGLILPSWKGERFGADGGSTFQTRRPDEREDWVREINVLAQSTGTGGYYRWPGTGREPWGQGYTFGESGWKIEDWYCCEREETRASVLTGITVNCPQGIATLLDIPVKKLPWPLQHFYAGRQPYVGNSILDRIDPEGWVLKNPWPQRMKLHVRMMHCKGAIHARRKKLGLARRKEWGVEDSVKRPVTIRW